jgi:ABC-type amino acid transport substrate-binding protein
MMNYLRQAGAIWAKTRRLRWIAVGLGILALIWAAGGASRLWTRGDETWARIQQRGTLRVGMDASYPPFEWVDGEGQFHGYDVELARMLGERWGVDVVFISAHLDGLYDALKVDRFDLIISALPYDRTMTRDVLYSSSYFNAAPVLLVPDRRADVQAIDDLVGGRVGVELGSEAHFLVRRLTRDRGLAVDLVVGREPDEVLSAVTAERVDAIVCDRVTAYGYVQRIPELRMVGAPLGDEPYVVATRHDSPVLIERVNEALAEWHADGTLEELGRRWFGAGQGGEMAPDG